MINQREGQQALGFTLSTRARSSPLRMAGWGMLGVAVVLWVVASLILVHSASPPSGWGLLVAFAILIGGGLSLIVASGPVERRLSRRSAAALVRAWETADGEWVAQWEELMRRSER